MTLRAFFLLALILCAPSLCAAEIVLPNIENAVTLTLSPVHPEAGDVVTVTAHSSALDLGTSVLSWSVDGNELSSGAGLTSVQVHAGALGTETDVAVTAVATDNTLSSGAAAIIPTGVDLLFDSDSYTPPFYAGRALPSPGTTMRFQAIPFFTLDGKKLIAASDLTYTWRRNGIVLGSLSGAGRSTLVIPQQHLYGNDVISVDVTTSDQVLTGSASVTVPAQTPIIELYEDDPLLGVMYHQALAAASVFPNEEVTFAAVPYFASARTPDDNALTYAWSVNDDAIPQSDSGRNEITVSGNSSAQSALIKLELTHAQNLLLDATGGWLVNLSEAADSFHTGQ